MLLSRFRQGRADRTDDPNRPKCYAPVALTGWTRNRQGSTYACALSRNGSDWQETCIRDVASGADHPEVLHPCKFQEDLRYVRLAWLPDETGFFYARFPEPAVTKGQESLRQYRVFLHNLSSAQDQEILLRACPDAPDLNFVPIVTEDATVIVLQSGRTSATAIRPLCARCPNQVPSMLRRVIAVEPGEGGLLNAINITAEQPEPINSASFGDGWFIGS